MLLRIAEALEAFAREGTTMDTINARSANGASDTGLVSTLAGDVAVAPPEAPTAEEAPEALVLSAGVASTGPEVKLNFVNRSNDANNSQVVVFGQPVGPAIAEAALAWQVISNCGPGWSHPFTWPAAVAIGVVDPHGNVSPPLDIAYGQLAEVVATPTGTALRISEQPGPPDTIGLVNLLPQGVVAATVFRAGKPYARQSLWPQTRSIFSFKPTIWIGVVSQIEEGEGIESAVASQVDTEISLLGVASADIVMTGGGAGPDAKPFVFTLQNIVRG